MFHFHFPATITVMPWRHLLGKNQEVSNCLMIIFCLWKQEQAYNSNFHPTNMVEVITISFKRETDKCHISIKHDADHEGCNYMQRNLNGNH